jgi:hypothetical protein
MARFHTTAEGNILFTAEEEAERDAEEAQYLAQQIEKAKIAYKANRASEYPPIGDQLDALFKAGLFPADMALIIQSVKDKYPKPSE